MSQDWHIASLLVQSFPDALDALLKSLGQDRFAELYPDKRTSRLVIVLEAPTLYAIEATIAELESAPHVLSVAMVYHHCEDHASLEETL